MKNPSIMSIGSVRMSTIHNPRDIINEGSVYNYGLEATGTSAIHNPRVYYRCPSIIFPEL
jgi:hypothetical protein